MRMFSGNEMPTKMPTIFQTNADLGLPILHEMRTFQSNKNKAHLNHHPGGIVTQVKTDIF